MHVDDRLQLARSSYRRAIERARSVPTRASWARLLTAAKNLREAMREKADLSRLPGTPVGA